MRISNLRDYKKLGVNAHNWVEKATVSVQARGFFSRKVTMEITRNYGHHWFFTESGEFTPDLIVENLVNDHKEDNLNDHKTKG